MDSRERERRTDSEGRKRKRELTPKERALYEDRVASEAACFEVVKPGGKGQGRK